MSERYTKLFSLPMQAVDPDSDIPVQIEAGALLKDNKSQMVIAQVKFRNISAKSIKEMTVAIKTFDSTGNAIKGTQGFQYRNQAAGSGDYFGDRVAVPMTDNNANSFSMEIVKVLFSDGSSWNKNMEQALEAAKTVGDETTKAAKDMLEMLKHPSKDFIEKLLLVGNCIFTMIMLFVVGRYIGKGLKGVEDVVGFVAAVLITIVTIPGLGKIIFKKTGYGLFQRYLRWGSALAIFFVAQIIIGVCLIMANPSTEKASAAAKQEDDQNIDVPLVEEENNEKEAEIEYMICTVSEMMELLETNAMKAESTYQDKNIEVTGRLSVIDSDGSYIALYPLDDEWALNGVTCYLQNDQQKQQIMEMQIDDIVTLKGKITDIGELLGYNLDIHNIY